ncbi:MAG: 3-dehydro-L-gulonate 2-dehydrogenase [Bacteroidetes bacterium]|nr:3-dehydro-L-gulonate 2-dehydrogenase [Bacteroidota bacterium]
MAILKYDELFFILKEKLLNNNFKEEPAQLCAQIFTENTFAGVASHGTNRFVSFLKLVNEGYINPNAKTSLVNSFGSWEQWDGNLGPGPVNAWNVTGRVIELAKENGMGCVSLKNTNHWMRGGTYGWRAAEEGVILISWTNTIPIMPPWGAKEPAVGNNPFVLAVPRINGHVVLDMALSLFSFGKLSTYKHEGKELPFAGGYDSDGNLTTNPAEISATHRPLPIGYWKGSGLAILFDLIAVLLSGGKSTFELGLGKHDSAMSQVFIAFDPQKFNSAESINDIADNIINSVKKAEPINEGEEIYYPGERTLKTREQNLRDGVFVADVIWGRIVSF